MIENKKFPAHGEHSYNYVHEMDEIRIGMTLNEMYDDSNIRIT